MKVKQTRNTLAPVYLDALRLRQQVFVKEQGVPLALEIDDQEALCLHFVLYNDLDQPLATCRILPDPEGEKVILQRFAVAKAYRRQGLGHYLLQRVIDYCKAQAMKQMTLHAQLTAQAFYASFGFLPQGEPFFEAGIEHLTMTKVL
ncbi:GNAT family N-acetyltransferase [Streptococcus halichoeri]|uniref:GNAT family N-acetyltransferase n=1 Tax=Streptococcus halichoeri TaxID=254785 RepID=UPI00135B1F4D|nr:GNAT family N-acetyltransferase [Streptococcus halichoeri]